MEVTFFILLFLIGACLGSFLCCQARRLHLKATAKRGSKKLNPRSVCLHCHKQLKWYDNIPIISWLVLRGHCRYCKKPIGSAEIISELGTGLAFIALGTTINFSTADAFTWATFIAVLLLTLTLIFLAIYDGLYGELPLTCLIVAIAFAAIILILRIVITLSTASFTPTLIVDPLLSVLILSGLYLLLYLVSKGKWVGDGDWLLSLAIAIALASPWLALITLFLTNLLACLYALPTLKKSRSHQIHLGPFLVIAFIIVIVFSTPLLEIIK